MAAFYLVLALVNMAICVAVVATDSEPAVAVFSGLLAVFAFTLSIAMADRGL